MSTKAQLEEDKKELIGELRKLDIKLIQEQDKTIAAQRAAKENMEKWQKASADVNINADIISMHEKDIAKLKERLKNQADTIQKLRDQKAEAFGRYCELEDICEALKHAIDIIYNNQG